MGISISDNLNIANYLKENNFLGKLYLQNINDKIKDITDFVKEDKNQREILYELGKKLGKAREPESFFAEIRHFFYLMKRDLNPKFIIQKDLKASDVLTINNNLEIFHEISVIRERKESRNIYKSANNIENRLKFEDYYFWTINVYEPLSSEEEKKIANLSNKKSKILNIGKTIEITLTKDGEVMLITPNTSRWKEKACISIKKVPRKNKGCIIFFGHMETPEEIERTITKLEKKRKARQLPKDKPGLIVLDIGFDLPIWEDIIKGAKDFLRKTTSVSGVFLRKVDISSMLDAEEFHELDEKNEVPEKNLLIRNINCNYPLSYNICSSLCDIWEGIN